MKNDPIRIYALPEQQSYFYRPELWDTGRHIMTFLSDAHDVHLFPEATLKMNKIPNGLLVRSKKLQTLLMPAILRDPGCGFLIFRLHNLRGEPTQAIAKTLLQFCQHLEMDEAYFSLSHWRDVLCQGVDQYSAGKEPFSNTRFDLDPDALYLELDKDELNRDLTRVSNTIELKTYAPASEKSQEAEELLGFIHTGSEYFPAVLHEEWASFAATFCYMHQLASDEQIAQGLFGIPADDEKGYQYQQALKAAMNYCLFKRYWLFHQLRDFLAERFNIMSAIMSDHCHAGLFEVKENNGDYLLQSRGVQLLSHPHLPYLIAGQKESESYLFNTNATTLAYCGHGTSYAFDAAKNYGQLLGQQDALHCLRQLQHVIANTGIETEKCLPYTYNIRQQKQYLEQFNLKFIRLYPLFNYQGPYLRSVSHVNQSTA